ncbi:hypothetical protein X781_19250 [Mannheimia sp. USDA-ARS-USMARC-1261]|nr:hypothetical protein X781_19250 [Mannheimia sp. USDA-ARS-USMARC-1261]
MLPNLPLPLFAKEGRTSGQICKKIRKIDRLQADYLSASSTL